MTDKVIYVCCNDEALLSFNHPVNHNKIGIALCGLHSKNYINILKHLDLWNIKNIDIVED